MTDVVNDVATDIAVDAAATDTVTATDTGGDASACADLSGAWSLAGTCSLAGSSTYPSACITQTGCNGTIVVSPGALPGTIVGDTMTFSTTLAGSPLACTATLNARQLEVHCETAGGAVTCDAIGTHPSFPGASRFCCDVVAQDCGAGQRCNIVGDDAMNRNLMTACVPAGSLASGASCMLTGGRVGAEDCGTGLFCANTGQAPTTARICQPLCTNTGGCGANEICTATSQTPRAGLCRPTCTLRGTDCASGTSCRALYTWGATDPLNARLLYATFCGAAGTGAEGNACTDPTMCGPNLTCARAAGESLACRQSCSASAPCPGGRACRAFDDAANPGGFGSCAAM